MEVDLSIYCKLANIIKVGLIKIFVNNCQKISNKVNVCFALIAFIL